MSSAVAPIHKVVEGDWPALLAMLPQDLDASAKEKGALVRKRVVKSAAVLLRLMLAYGFCGLSLRETAAWADGSKICSVSDVALLKRFKKSVAWLGHLLAQMLEERAKLCLSDIGKYRLRIVDATSVCRPGSKGSDFKVHLGLDLRLFAVDHVALTDAKGGETLSRIPAGEGEVFVCDRAYGHRKGIWSVVKAGSEVIVRISWLTLSLLHPDGSRFDILQELSALRDNETGDFPVAIEPCEREGIPSVPGRLVALRRDEKDVEKARRRVRKEAQRKGKTPDKRSLAACEYVFVFTTLPVEDISARRVLEIYRLRWQIELVFRRMKSIAGLDELAAKDDELCRAAILAKLLAILLVEDVSLRLGAFSP